MHTLCNRLQQVVCTPGALSHELLVLPQQRAQAVMKVIRNNDCRAYDYITYQLST